MRCLQACRTHLAAVVAGQVLFSQACWVGSQEDNPDEEQLAWPEAVLAPDSAEDAVDPLDPLAAPQGAPCLLPHACQCLEQPLWC